MLFTLFYLGIKYVVYVPTKSSILCSGCTSQEKNVPAAPEVLLNFSVINHVRSKPKIKLRLNAAKPLSAIAYSSDLMRRNHCIPSIVAMASNVWATGQLIVMVEMFRGSRRGSRLHKAS